MTAFVRTVILIVIIGAINWGLVGIFNWNLVAAIFGGPTGTDMSGLTRLIYIIVGLAGLAALFMLPVVKGGRPGMR